MTAQNYLTYMHLLTPLHTGGSADEGNMMGIAREVHTEFPYLPASSLRGKIRSELEHRDDLKQAAGVFFGKKIEGGSQPTEGEVWFADATLLFFPISSLSHHLVWITCPLWLDRWSRWVGAEEKAIMPIVKEVRGYLSEGKNSKSAVINFSCDALYLQTALLRRDDIQVMENLSQIPTKLEATLAAGSILSQLKTRLIVINDEDCNALVELGLQREVRIAIDNEQKTVKGGSFRSEEAVPPEAVLFFPWGVKTERQYQANKSLDAAKQEAERKQHEQKLASNTLAHEGLREMLKTRLQFGGLEGLGRGWASLQTISTSERN
jgi:CRISPR-associated protein Cmr4